MSGLIAAACFAVATGARAQILGQAGQDALETARSGTATQWVNPDTGAVETITPKPAFQGADGGPCREFQKDVRIGGQVQQAWGIACRQPDGSWRLQRPSEREVIVAPTRVVTPPTTVIYAPPPPPVVYTYPPYYYPRPVYYPPPVYYPYPQPYYHPRPHVHSSVGIGIHVGGRSHGHHHRR